MTWTTRNGHKIPLHAMTDQHVKNALRMMTAQADAEVAEGDGSDMLVWALRCELSRRSR